MYWQRGELAEEQVLLVCKHLPIDMSFADEDDILRFWSGASAYKSCDARFIGRDVRDCHPKSSLPVLEEILRAFKAGEKDVAEGWSTDKHGKTTLVRYFAVRDGGGTYKGILETLQDITDVRTLEGEQSLPGW